MNSPDGQGVIFIIVATAALLAFKLPGMRWVESVYFAAAIIVGFLVASDTGSIPSGVFAAIAAVVGFSFLSWRGARQIKKGNAQRFFSSSEGRAYRVALRGFGNLDGTVTQRARARHMLDALADEVESTGRFAVDRLEAMSMLDRLETERLILAVAVLYSAASCTTQYDFDLIDEDVQIVASEFWLPLEDFLISKGHSLGDRWLIEYLMLLFMPLLEDIPVEQPVSRRAMQEWLQSVPEIIEPEAYSIGDTFEHELYGVGWVTEVAGGTITVEFLDGAAGTKSLPVS